MSLEKSCGAVVYRKLRTEVEFLAVKSKINGHWGFPKGQMKNDESEEETAKREVFEETGLSIILLDGFKTKVEYMLSENRLKEVTFYIGTTLDHSVSIQNEEIQEYKWLNYNNMFDLLNFENNKKVLMEVRNILNRGE